MGASAATALAITQGEYLASTYRPDVDFVEGRVERRHVGETDHALLQVKLILLLATREQGWGIRVLSESRIQVAMSRFRVPDVCVMPSSWVRTKIVTEAPLLCVEILSPRDSVMAMRRRVQDFLQMGVPVVWILDPETRTAYVLDGAGMREMTEGVLRVEGTAVEVGVVEVFRTLDA